jgi:hypothetical protein
MEPTVADQLPKLVEEQHCPICYDDYCPPDCSLGGYRHRHIRPYQLNCAHGACKPCWQKMAFLNDGIVKCPFCKFLTGVPLPETLWGRLSLIVPQAVQTGREAAPQIFGVIGLTVGCFLGNRLDATDNRSSLLQAVVSGVKVGTTYSSFAIITNMSHSSLTLGPALFANHINPVYPPLAAIGMTLWKRRNFHPLEACRHSLKQIFLASAVCSAFNTLCYIASGVGTGAPVSYSIVGIGIGYYLGRSRLLRATSGYFYAPVKIARIATSFIAAGASA